MKQIAKAMLVVQHWVLLRPKVTVRLC